MSDPESIFRYARHYGFPVHSLRSPPGMTWLVAIGGAPSMTARRVAPRIVGFLTIEQCKATVSGIGGVLEPQKIYEGGECGSIKPSGYRAFDKSRGRCSPRLEKSKK